MAQFGYNSDIDKAVANAAGRAARAGNLTVALKRLGDYHVRKGVRILASGERGIRTRNSRSGLAKSLTYRIAGQNSLTIGSQVPYAASQQFGPRNGFYESSRPGGFLAIPIGDAVNAGGVAKTGYETPRNFPDGAWIRTKLGNLLFIVPLGTTKKGKAKSRNKFRGKLLDEANPLRAFRVLFLGLARVAGYAHRYITHDPADTQAWNAIAADWILKGR